MTKEEKYQLLLEFVQDCVWHCCSSQEDCGCDAHLAERLLERIGESVE